MKNKTLPAGTVAAAAPKVFAFECNLAGSPHSTTINSTCRSKAKTQFFHKLDGDFPYVSIRARKLGPPHTSKDFLRNARYRGMPDVRCGDPVMVGDVEGTIVGHNSSANLDIQFPQDSIYKGQVLNVHPQGIKLLNKRGEVHA